MHDPKRTQYNSYKFFFFVLLREAAKKFFFFSGLSTKKGGWFRGCPLKKKQSFFLFKFVAVEKLNIFCLRRYIQILILVY